MGYLALHRKTRTIHPREGVFTSLGEAVEFAKRKEAAPDARRWQFGKSSPDSSKRSRIRPLPPDEKRSVPGLWLRDRAAEAPAAPVAPPEPPAPTTPPPPPEAAREAVVPPEPERITVPEPQLDPVPERVEDVTVEVDVPKRRGRPKKKRTFE